MLTSTVLYFFVLASLGHSVSSFTNSPLQSLHGYLSASKRGYRLLQPSSLIKSEGMENPETILPSNVYLKDSKGASKLHHIHSQDQSEVEPSSPFLRSLKSPLHTPSESAESVKSPLRMSSFIRSLRSPAPSSAQRPSRSLRSVSSEFWNNPELRSIKRLKALGLAEKAMMMLMPHSTLGLDRLMPGCTSADGSPCMNEEDMLELSAPFERRSGDQSDKDLPPLYLLGGAIGR